MSTVQISRTVSVSTDLSILCHTQHQFIWQMWADFGNSFTTAFADELWKLLAYIICHRASNMLPHYLAKLVIQFKSDTKYVYFTLNIYTDVLDHMSTQINQWRFYVGARGHRPPKSCPGPQIFGHSSSATG